MNEYSKRYELKDRAKDTLRGNYGILILGSFLFSLIICLVIFIFGFAFFISLVASMYSGSPYSVACFRIFQAGLLIGQLLSGFLTFGISYLCLKLACGQPGSYMDVFYGFRRENLPKTLLLSAVQVLLNVLCLAPYEYLRTRYLNVQGLQWLLAALLALVIGYAIYIPISLTFDITYYLLLDFPDKKAAEIIRDSFRVIRGHRGRFFLLQCSFIPLYLLCELSLGIGFLWLTPYIHMTLVLFYLDLFHPGKGNA